MLDYLKLLRTLRRIWFRVAVVTPAMVVDSIKAIYTFVTGRAPCIVLILTLITASAPAATVYRLARPKTASSYHLSAKAPSKTKLSTATKADKLIVASATWCQPCKRLYPIIEKLAREGYNAKVVYDYKGPGNVRAYPTLLFFKNGKLVDTLVGVQTEAEIKRRLTK